MKMPLGPPPDSLRGNLLRVTSRGISEDLSRKLSRGESLVRTSYESWFAPITVGTRWRTAVPRRRRRRFPSFAPRCL